MKDARKAAMVDLFLQRLKPAPTEQAGVGSSGHVWPGKEERREKEDDQPSQFTKKGRAERV
jgi:hypothetical protein